VVVVAVVVLEGHVSRRGVLLAKQGRHTLVVVVVVVVEAFRVLEDQVGPRDVVEGDAPNEEALKGLEGRGDDET